jgi:hypothetical protein
MDIEEYNENMTNIKEILDTMINNEIYIIKQYTNECIICKTKINADEIYNKYHSLCICDNGCGTIYCCNKSYYKYDNNYCIGHNPNCGK